MSDYTVRQAVEVRIKRVYHMTVVLSPPEIAELEKALGVADEECHIIIAKIDKTSDEELYKLVLAILKKRKKKGKELEILAGVG